MHANLRTATCLTWVVSSVGSSLCIIAVKVSWRSIVRSAVCWQRKLLKSIRRFQQLWSRSILWWSTNTSLMPTGQKVNSHWETVFTKLSAHLWPTWSCNRSPETPEASVEFESSLLEETENLPANEILWNTLTADSLQTMWASVL